MSDEELRDKLASEFADNVQTMNARKVERPDVITYCFKAGWAAARANIPGSMFQMLTIVELEHERDQLKDQLQWSLRNEEKYKAALDDSFKRENELRAKAEEFSEMLLAINARVFPAEIDSIDSLALMYQERKAQAKVIEGLRGTMEKLAEALEFYSSQWRSDVYVGPTNELIEDSGRKAQAALAEYRKQTKGK